MTKKHEFKEAMELSYVFMAMAVVITAMFIFVEMKESSLFSLFFKALASFSFILLFSIVISEKTVQTNSPYYIGEDFVSFLGTGFLIFMGLVAGLIGDLLLGLRPLRPSDENDTIITSGIFSFAIGHIFYYFALIKIWQFSVYPLIIGVVGAAIIYFGAKILNMKMRKLLIPSLAYAFLLFAIFGQALFGAINLDFSVTSILLFVGATLFLVSDLILSQIYFKEGTKRVMVVYNYATYYGAQILIAFSILFLTL